MQIIFVLLPISLFLAAVGLGAYLWCVRSDQYRDLDGDARRLLLDDDKK